MLILRVENYKGEGMYTACGSLVKANFPDACKVYGINIRGSELERRLHPSPYIESFSLTWENLHRVNESDNYLFGFGSVAQLRKWLINKDIMKELHNYGYRVAVIVAQGVKGKRQVLFNKETVQIKSYLSVLDFQ